MLIVLHIDHNPELLTFQHQTDLKMTSFVLLTISFAHFITKLLTDITSTRFDVAVADSSSYAQAVVAILQPLKK